jgi:phage terminase small subunit
MSADDAAKKKRLTSKERLFVEHYLVCWNASEAARKAGYSVKSAREIGYQNLTKLHIAEAVKERIAQIAMSADEVLLRLGEHARGDMGDFFDVDKNGNWAVNLKKAKRQKKLRLIKKVETTTRLVGEDQTPETTIKFELHDAQAALVHLGRHHKLFTEKIEGNGINGAFQHQLLTTAATELVEKSADDLKRYGSKLADLWK